MCRAAGAVFVRFEQLPEEARNFIEKCRNAALVADVGASCGGVVRLFLYFLLCNYKFAEMVNFKNYHSVFDSAFNIFP